MTAPITSALLIAAALAVSTGDASAKTLGERLADGSLSPAAFTQLIAGTGLTIDEAMRATLNQVSVIKLESLD